MTVPNLLAKYKCNENAATTDVDDSSGNSLDGTLTGGNNTADVTTTGPNNDANTGFDLNGTTDYVSLGAPSSILTTTQGSVDLWFYAPGNLADQEGGALFAYGGADVLKPGYFQLQWRRLDSKQSGQRLVIWQRNDGEDNFNTVFTPQLAAPAWYHVVMTGDGSTWKIYLNGVLQSLTTHDGSNTGVWFGGTTIGSGELLSLGARKFDGSIGIYLDGKISDVNFHATPLTQGMVTRRSKAQNYGLALDELYSENYQEEVGVLPLLV